jgi:membrane associated rhomboid family serine protease
MTTWVQRLIIANAAMFILSYAMPEIYRLFVFVPALVVVRPWTPLTYMFLHAGVGHLLFNMLALFFLGPRVELQLGERDFLLLYLVSGLVAAAFSFVLAPGAPIVGASGAVYGVLLAFALFWPHERLLIWGVLPVEARWLVIGLAALSLFSGVSGAGPGIAHFAHLGGFAGGWLFLRWRGRRIAARRLGPRGPSTLDRVSGKTRREVESWRAIPLDRLHPINREEVERILRKLDAHGDRSLTPDERAFMNRMSGMG